MADFNKINGKPIYWIDKRGVTHRCEGGYIHGDSGDRLLWTKCGRDVPANSAFIADSEDATSCPKCLEKMSLNTTGVEK